MEKLVTTTTDPCQSLLQNYIDCVSEHTRGLSDGDDCSDQTLKYKTCRQKEKEKLRSNQKHTSE